MISVSEACAAIDSRVAPLATETASLAQAHGRILREAVAVPEDLPPFDRSAMDGYAVREDECADDLDLVGEIRAGQAIDLHLLPGQTVRIFTGARLPEANLKVVRQEDVQAQGNRIRLLKKSDAPHVRKKGEDARAGEILLEPGAILDAAAVALIASLGQTRIAVSRRPKILHLTTGDEIVPPEQVPQAGQIRNSNAFLISALCREQGIDAIIHLHAPDDWPELLRIVAEAQPETFDLILISGGSGSGIADFSADLFRHLGAAIHFREVNVRPGKPLIFGSSPAQIVFGLPGNALSHFVCFHLFVRRALDRMLARPVSVTHRAHLTATMPDTLNDRETWWPAQAGLHNTRLECRALPWKSSGDITRLPAANALLHVPPSTSHLPEGTMVELLLTRNLAN